MTGRAEWRERDDGRSGIIALGFGTLLTGRCWLGATDALAEWLAEELARATVKRPTISRRAAASKRVCRDRSQTGRDLVACMDDWMLGRRRSRSGAAQ